MGESLQDLCEPAEWRGIGLEEIYNNHGPFDYPEEAPIVPSDSHTVLFRVNHDRLEALPAVPSDNWFVDWIRMPHSSTSIYPYALKERTKSGGGRLRFDVIRESLEKKILSSVQLEEAIFSYNYRHARHWNFCALHNLFTRVMKEEETERFFGDLLPRMIQLALQLPDLIVGSIPILKRNVNRSISLSQLQIASILANAFFCTFPNYRKYPNINFNRLFSAYKKEKAERSSAVAEKLRCLLHYFQRVTTKIPEGVVTFERRWIPKESCPDWKELTHQLPPLHITARGTIESDGPGLLQVDFANKKVGGGVLNWGCVQEEIRFVICPELIATRLVTHVLEETEVLVVTGVERFSEYEGYGNHFKWAGDFVDDTPWDTCRRRKTTIVAMDATRFTRAKAQYSVKNVTRELNKAFVGFSCSAAAGGGASSDLPAVSTGNWGCGAFRGDPRLKAFLQMIAAAVHGRSLVYFTFGDAELRDRIADMYSHLRLQKNFTIGTLYSLICGYEEESERKNSDLYRYLLDKTNL